MLQTRFLLTLFFAIVLPVLLVTSGCGHISKEASDDRYPDIADMGDQGTRKQADSLSPSSNFNTVSTANTTL